MKKILISIFTFSFLLINFGCAVYYTQKVPELKKPPVVFSKKYLTACAFVKGMNKETGSENPILLKDLKYIKKMFQRSGYFKEVYATDSYKLGCDINFTYTYFTVPLSFSKTLWTILTTTTLGIIPFRHSSKNEFEVEVVDRKMNRSKKYHYEADYVYWYSIALLPSMLLRNADSLTYGAYMINQSIDEVVKDFEI